MKKLFTLAIALISVSASLSAQQLTAGPVMGLNYNSIQINESFMVNDIDYTFRTDGGGVGLMAGAFVNFNYHNFFTETRLTFAQERSTAHFADQYTSREQVVHLNKVYLPVKLGYRIKNTYNVFGGLQWSHYVDGSMVPSNTALYVAYDNTVNPNAFGFFLGFGVQISKFNLNLNYSGNFSEAGIQANYKRQSLPFKTHDQLFNLTLSYNIVDRIFKKEDEKEEELPFDPKEVLVTDE